MATTQEKQTITRRNFLRLTAVTATAVALELNDLTRTTPNVVSAHANPQPQTESQNNLASNVYLEHYEWRNNDPNDYPELNGCIGSEIVLPWNQLHIGPNQFNWTALDTFIDDITRRNLKINITDNNGHNQEIYKPITLSPVMVLSGTSGSDTSHFTPCIPDFVKAQVGNDGVYTIPQPRAECPTQVIPKYDHPFLQQSWLDFISAIKENYANRVFPGTNQPVLSEIEPHSSGIDQEVGNLAKSAYINGVSCNYPSAAGSVLNYYAYLDACRNIYSGLADILKDTDLPATVLYTADGKKLAFELLTNADQYPRVMSLGQATGAADGSNWHQISSDGSDFGIESLFKIANDRGIPTKIETANRYSLPKEFLSIYAMFAIAHPARVSLLHGVFDDIHNNPGLAQEYRYLRPFMDKTPETGPEVWWTGRETDFPLKPAGSVKYGGHSGDFTWGLERLQNVGNDQTIVYGDLQESGAWATRNPALPSPAKDHLWGLRARGNAPGSRYMFFKVNQEWERSHRQSPSFSSLDLRLRFVNDNRGAITINYIDRTTGSIKQIQIQKDASLGPLNQFAEAKATLFGARVEGLLNGGSDFFLDAGENGTMIVQSLSLKPSTLNKIFVPTISSD